MMRRINSNFNKVITGIFIIAICLFIPGCTEKKQTNIQPTNISLTITPTQTITSTVTPPAPTMTPTPSPTPWQVMYPTKQVLLRYAYGVGDHSVYEVIVPDANYFGIILQIYTDGQFIIQKSDGHYWETYIPQKEIEKILLKLDQLGFFKIETNNQHDPTDPLYQFGPDDYFESYDGLETVISVYGDNPRSISIYQPLAQFIIKPMKTILKYLNNYSPTGLTLYQPDRLILYCDTGRGEWLDPSMPAIPWPEDVTPISTYSVSHILYLQGIEASTIYQLITANDSVFTSNGTEYTCSYFIIFPDQCSIMTYDTSSYLEGVQQPEIFCEE